MFRRTTVAALGSLVIPGAVVLTGSAGASQSPKHLGVSLRSCMQTHVSSSEDDFDIVVTVDERGNVVKKRKHRPKRHHRGKKAAIAPATGAAVSATLTGPYVTSGQASGTTDATGTARLKLTISGPGSYTLSLSVTKAGDTPASVTKTIDVSGPTNAACSLS